ncbi:MAG: PAS domain-containing protein [Myxococcales bacterium]|nr:PAS domain-containing protein [Myxococcales bacterium]
MYPQGPTPNSTRPPARWVRFAIGLAVLGYAATSLAALLGHDPELGEDLTALGFLLVALALSGRRPSLAAGVALLVIWAEITVSSYRNAAVLTAGTFVYPLLTVVAGLMFGGRAAVVAGAVSAATIPLTLAATGALFHLRSRDVVTLTVVVVVIAITALFIRYVLAAYFAALQGSERMRARLVDWFEHAPDGIVVLDRDGRISQLNELAASYLGADRARLLGTPLVDALGGAGARDRPSLLRSLVDDETPPLTLVSTAEGRWLEVRARRVDLGVQLILRDQTERRALEERLAHTQRIETIGQLAGSVAHDFNNLLMVVQGNASLLLTHDDPQAREAGAEIEDATERGMALTRHLLSLARKGHARPEDLDLCKVVKDLERIGRRLLTDQHQLRVVADGSHHVVADQTHLEQIVLNLVSNARDAMPEGGEVLVRVRRLSRRAAKALDSALEAGEQVVLEVSDTGTGMSAETRARIFEPFFTTKPKGRGTGLGLATVQSIVAASAGHVTVETALARGSTFRIFFAAAMSLDAPLSSCSRISSGHADEVATGGLLRRSS